MFDYPKSIIFIPLGKTSIIVAGGRDEFSNEFSKAYVLDKHDQCQLPDLPKGMRANPSILQHGSDVIICGGGENCFKLEDNKWSVNTNSMIRDRRYGTSITMKDSVYILGGWVSLDTSEMLVHESEAWKLGPNIPYGGIAQACGVKISEKEFLIIGGFMMSNRSKILRYNANTNTWHNTSIQLEYEKYAHRCMLFDGKVIVTGGYGLNGSISTVEIIDIEDSELKIRKGKDMIQKRASHGMGILNLDNKPTLIAFGGYNTDTLEFLSSVELWNNANESWEISANLALKKQIDEFGHATLLSELICP